MYRNNSITDDYLRQEVKALLEDRQANYTEKEIAEYLEIRQSSMYNWFAGQYNFSRKTKERLLDIIDNLKG